MKIYMFNKDQDWVKLGVDIIVKYLDNIYLYFEEEKYWKIKLQNKVFQECINCLEGIYEFFEVIGFQKVLFFVQDQEDFEEFYVLSEIILVQFQSLERYKEQLLVVEFVCVKLDRQCCVFQFLFLVLQFELFGDFFNFIVEEIKWEQRFRFEVVEWLSVLWIKVMWEKEEQWGLCKYNYMLLCVCFFDGCFLQGIFYVWEWLGVVYGFVWEVLQSDWLFFELLVLGGQKLFEDENLVLNECGLVFFVFLIFLWDMVVLEDIKVVGVELDFILKFEFLLVIEKFL